MCVQEDFMLALWRLETVGYEGAERQRGRSADTSWIGAGAGNSGDAGDCGLYDGIGGVHGVTVFVDSLAVEI